MNIENTKLKLSKGKRCSRQIVITMLFCTLLLMGVIQSASASSYNYIDQWGSWGSEDGQFSNESAGVAVDATGNVYVADVYNNRIQKFDSNGKFILKWQVDNLPVFVAFGKTTGYLYVTEYTGNKVDVFTVDGDFIKSFDGSGTEGGQFLHPRGVAVDNLGNIYVVDCENSRVQKFDSTGTFLAKWGNYGTSDGEFSNVPVGIAVDSNNNFYVTDYTNNNVQKFDSTGTFLGKLGSDGQFNHPQGIAVDGGNNVYVCDGNDRVQKFNSIGDFVLAWGTSGSNDGEFNYPVGVAIDNTGYVYVFDSHNYRVQKFQFTPDFVLPEVPMGTTIVVMMAALMVFTAFKHIRQEK